MQITIRFDNWEELVAFRGNGGLMPPIDITVKPKKKKQDPEPAPVAEPAPEPDPEPAAPEPVIDMAMFREQVKDALYQWNTEHPGEKPAQKAIKAMGYTRLADVPDDRLQELLEAAGVK